MAATLDASLRLDSSQFTAGLGRSMKDTNAAVSKMSAAFSMLKNVAIGGAVGSAFMDVARSVTAAYIEAEKLQNALKATAGNDLVGMAQYERLKQLSAEIGVSIQSAAKGSLQLQAVGMSAMQSLKTIKTLQNSILSSGGGAEDLDRLLYGLKQLYGSAKPLQEEINQINEAFAQAPALFNKAFGTARAEEMQKLGLTGKQVAEGLIKMAEAMPKVARGLQGELDGLAAKWQSLKASGVFSAITLPAVGIASGTLDVFSRIGTEISDALNLMSGVDPAELRRRQADVIAGLEKEQKIAKDKSDADAKALADKKTLQEKLDKGNKENAELDRARWQWEEQWLNEKLAKEKQAQDEAKRAADQAKKDADELADKQEAAMRRLQGAQESIYANKQNNTEDDYQRLENAKDELRKFQGGELDGQTYGPGLISANKYADAFEKLANACY